MITIKKYANRKLYDTSTSLYINLRDIPNLIRQGETVRVVDYSTGRDLTTHTLVSALAAEGSLDLNQVLALIKDT